jgi:hypothetical protein
MTTPRDASDRLSGAAELELMRRFGDALRAAILDKKLERHARVVYYYDADVVIPMILGFQQFTYGTKPPRKQRRLRPLFVRSLLSVGYLGTVSLLRPHAFEVDDAVRRKPAFRSELGRDDYKRALMEFLSEWKVTDRFAELYAIIKSSSKADRIDRFFNELQQIGSEGFVPIELANGNWQQRLVRLGTKGILRFDNTGEDVDQIIHDPALEEFRTLIADQRSADEKKFFPLSIFRDAMALTSIHRMICRRKGGEDVPWVRFYTETEALQNAWNNNLRVRSMLSYGPATSGAWESCPDFVGRSVDYFVVRALFEALRFPGVRLKRSSGRPPMTFAALEEVSKQLTALPDEADPLLLHRKRGELQELLRLAGQSSEGPSVGDYLELFRQLSFIRSFWVRYQPPIALRRFVEGFQEVWAFAQEGASGDEIRRRVSRRLVEVQGELRTHLGSMRDFFSTLSGVQESSRRYLKGRDTYLPPNPMRDLGLVRWGVDLSGGALNRFRDFVSPLIAKDEDDWRQGCLDFTSAIRDIGANEEDCAVICSILWWLNEFRTVEQVLEHLEGNLKAPFPMWAVVMHSAARLQRRDLGFMAKARLVERLRKSVHTLSQSSRRRYLVGLGYVLFHAWKSEQDRGKAAPQSRQVVLASWVHQSFIEGDRAFRGLRTGSLLWAFAVNHCAYVGTVADIERSKTAARLTQLASFETNSDLWNYRFVDTLAYSYYLDAKRFWSTHLGERTNMEGVRKHVWGILKNAYGVYERARQYFGDHEIPMHQSELNQLAREVGFAYHDAVPGASQRIGHESSPDRM